MNGEKTAGQASAESNHGRIPPHDEVEVLQPPARNQLVMFRVRLYIENENENEGGYLLPIGPIEGGVE